MYSVVDIMEMAGISKEEIAKDVKNDIEMANYVEENANRGCLYRIEIKKICMETEPNKINKLWYEENWS